MSDQTYDKTITEERCEETHARPDCATAADAFGDLKDPANWAALVASGAAHLVNRATDVEIRIASTTNGATVVGEIWRLRKRKKDGKAAAGRKIADFTAVCGGPDHVNLHPFTGEASASTHYVADDITLDFNVGYCSIEPDPAVDTEECSIEVDPKGAEYLAVVFASGAGTKSAGLSNIG